jgi:hypothetical protein
MCGKEKIKPPQASFIFSVALLKNKKRGNNKLPRRLEIIIFV